MWGVRSWPALAALYTKERHGFGIVWQTFAIQLSKESDNPKIICIFIINIFFFNDIYHFRMFNKLILLSFGYFIPSVLYQSDELHWAEKSHHIWKFKMSDEFYSCDECLLCIYSWLKSTMIINFIKSIISIIVLKF